MLHVPSTADAGMGRNVGAIATTEDSITLPTSTSLIACRQRVGTRSCTTVDSRAASTARLRTKTSNRRRQSYSTSTAAESTIIVAYSLTGTPYAKLSSATLVIAARQTSAPSVAVGR